MNTDQPQIPSIPPEQSLVKKIFTPKFIAVIVGLLIVGGSAFGYLWYIRLSYYEQGIKIQQETDAKIQSLQQKRAQNPSASSGQVPVDWKTYINTQYGFEFKYPVSFKIDFETYDTYNRLVILKNEQFKFEVMIRDKSASLENYHYLDNEIDSKGLLGGRRANIYKSSTGYCDGPGCGAPFITYAADNDKYFYHMTFYGDTILSETEDQILSTFRFIDSAGKFCGGIAAFPCSAGYTCKLDGSYPDAGGTCIKN